jgi:hypothetical protein
MNKQKTETTDNTDKPELSPSVKSVSSVVKNPVSRLSDTFETVPPSAARSRVNAELQACYRLNSESFREQAMQRFTCRAVVLTQAERCNEFHCSHPAFSGNVKDHATSVGCNLDHCGRDCFWLEQAFQRLDGADAHKYNILVRQPCAVKARGAHGASTLQRFNALTL